MRFYSASRTDTGHLQVLDLLKVLKALTNDLLIWADSAHFLAGGAANDAKNKMRERFVYNNGPEGIITSSCR